MNTTTNDREGGTLRTVLRRTAVLVSAARKSPASSAALRRGSSSDVAQSAAFHRVLNHAQIDEDSIERLGAWASVIQCMAIGGAAQVQLSDGTMLARAGLSESRFSRLLSASGTSLADQCLLIARFLHSKEHLCCWEDLGSLLLLDASGSTYADHVRLRLAKDYFRTAGE